MLRLFWPYNMILDWSLLSSILKRTNGYTWIVNNLFRREKSSPSSVIATTKMMLHFHLSVKSGKKTHKQAIRETYGLIYQWAMVVVWVCVLLVFFCMPFCDVNWKMIGVYKPVLGESIVLTYLLLVLRFCFLVNHQFYSICKDERQYFFTVWFSFLSASSSSSVSLSTFAVSIRPSIACNENILQPITCYAFNDATTKVRK